MKTSRILVSILACGLLAACHTAPVKPPVVTPVVTGTGAQPTPAPTPTAAEKAAALAQQAAQAALRIGQTSGRPVASLGGTYLLQQTPVAQRSEVAKYLSCGALGLESLTAAQVQDPQKFSVLLTGFMLDPNANATTQTEVQEIVVLVTSLVSPYISSIGTGNATAAQVIAVLQQVALGLNDAATPYLAPSIKTSLFNSRGWGFTHGTVYDYENRRAGLIAFLHFRMTDPQLRPFITGHLLFTGGDDKRCIREI